MDGIANTTMIARIQATKGAGVWEAMVQEWTFSWRHVIAQSFDGDLENPILEAGVYARHIPIAIELDVPFVMDFNGVLAAWAIRA